MSGRGLDRRADFLLIEGFHLRLRPKAIGLLADRLPQNFNRAVPFEGKNRTFEAVLYETTRKIARNLLGQSKRLDLNFPFGALDGALDTQAAETISAVSYADARRLGISKAGLWDMKRRGADCEPVKAYRKLAEKLPST